MVINVFHLLAFLLATLLAPCWLHWDKSQYIGIYFLAIICPLFILIKMKTPINRGFERLHMVGRTRFELSDYHLKVPVFLSFPN